MCVTRLGGGPLGGGHLFKVVSENCMERDGSFITGSGGRRRYILNVSLALASINCKVDI